VYTDTHCHLGYNEHADPDTLVGRAREAGVGTIIDVGNDLASSVGCVANAAGLDGVWAAVGIHPNNAIESTEAVLERIKHLAQHPRVVGIGETGLDWFRDHCPPVRQEESFREHIRLAKELDKALIIHNRDAHDDIVRILGDERAPDRTVFHCFSGGPELVRTCAEAGWYMSFAGNVTFKNAPSLREAAKQVPLNLLLAETDAPFLSPHPHRGTTNEPARVTVTVALLAELHRVSAQEMARITSANARRLFALPEPDASAAN